MKRLLIYTVLIKALLLSLSGTSLSCEDNNSPKTQYKSFFPMIFNSNNLERMEEFCSGLCLNSEQYCWNSCVDFEENILGENYVKINGTYQIVEQLKIDLSKSLQGLKINNRSAIVEEVSKKFIDKDILDSLKKIDQLDLKLFIIANQPNSMLLVFDSEETYEVAKILIFVGKLDGKNLVDEVSNFVLEKEISEDELFDLDNDSKC